MTSKRKGGKKRCGTHWYLPYNLFLGETNREKGRGEGVNKKRRGPWRMPALESRKKVGCRERKKKKPEKPQKK